MDHEAILGARLPVRDSGNRTREELREEVARIYHSRRQHIFEMVLRSIHDAAAAEEVTQETFFRLYQHCVAGRSVENVVAWTLTVARNLATDRLRAQKHEKTVPEETWLTLLDTCADETDSPEEILAGQEALDRLAVLVELLPEAQRNCVKLYGRGLKFKEIAQALELPYHQALLFTRDGLNRIRRLMMRSGPPSE